MAYPRRTGHPNERGEYEESSSGYSQSSGYSSNQPSYGSNSASGYGSGQPAYGSGQQPYGSSQTTYSTGQPTYNSGQTTYGSGQGSYNSGQTTYGTGQGSYNTGQTVYGTGQSTYGTGQSTYGTGQSTYGTGQPNYSGSAATYGSGGAEYGSASSQQASAAGPNWRWWIPAEGITREVIQADIQRYLGPDALVRPGLGRDENASTEGYWIAAYRNLTSSMIRDLKADSTNWSYMRSRSGGAYEDSTVHRSRQYHGPSASAEQAAPTYPTEGGANYGTDSATRRDDTAYGSGRGAYAGGGRTAAGQDGQGNYAHGGANPYGNSSYDYSTIDPRSSVRPDAGTQSYGASPPIQSQRARPGYYIASDGREYPLSSMPARQQQR